MNERLVQNTINKVIDEVVPRAVVRGRYARFWAQKAQTKGKIAGETISRLLRLMGLNVTCDDTKNADKCVAGKTIEFKSSTLWKNGIFKFQQIRLNRNFHSIIGIALGPDNAWLYCIPFSELDVLRRAGMLEAQHDRNIAWLTFTPDCATMSQYGGRVSDPETEAKILRNLE